MTLAPPASEISASEVSTSLGYIHEIMGDILAYITRLDARLAELELLAKNGNELMLQVGPMLEGLKGNPMLKMLGIKGG